MENETVQVVEETSKHYVVKTDDGKHHKCFKIDTDEIDKAWREQVLYLASNLPPEMVKELLIKLAKNINNNPHVNEYFTQAKEISIILERMYTFIEKSSLLHHGIKDIDPGIYGKAQSFTKQIASLYKSFCEIADVMVDMDQLPYFENGFKEKSYMLIDFDPEQCSEETGDLVEKLCDGLGASSTKPVTHREVFVTFT